MARKKKESKLNMQESFLAHKYNISETTFLQIKSYIQYDENEKVEKWWSRVESNPYRLMSCEGFGFKRCDVIAQKVNFDMRSPVRINAYVSTAIENDAKGSSIVSFPKIIANIDKDLSINDIELVINSIKHSEDNDYVLLNGRYKLTEDKSTALYLTKKGWYYAEKFCFDWFKKLSKMNKPDVRGVRTFEKYPTLNVEQKYALEHFLDKNITLLIGGAGCLPHDTEVLTRDGWKAISECENEEIMVANPVDKEGIFGKFEKPIFRKYPVDQFYKITTGTNFDLTVSKEHKNLYITRKGAKYKDITTQELIDKMDLLDAHRKENEVKKSNLCVIPETFQWFGKGLDYSDDYIRLKVAVICDGYFAHNVKSNPYMCHVNLKKERKQQRLEYLLNKLNIKYTIQKSNEGYKNYYFCMDNDDKVFYKKWFFESNKHQREIIMEEILLWDGSTDKRDNSIGSFSTIIKETADTIQLIACSLGYRATMCKDPRKEKYSTGECYKITFSKNKLQGFHVMSSDTTKYEKVNQGEYMYCFTTSTGYFPIRQKNRIYITGNCGKSYLTKALLDLLDENKYTYKLLAPTGIASINLQQKTGRPCSTIHRTFYQQKDRKLDCDYLVIDELSMLGVDHFNMLSQIVRKDTRVLFIGDKFQLPSISAGDFLGSLMKCLSKGIFDGQILELKTIMRASDETFIPHLCQQFTNHNKFDSSVLYKKHNKVQFIKRKDTLLEDIKYIIDSNGWSFEDTMIISPQRKGELGLVKINEFFQNLNNNVIVYQDKFNTFKQGDYCMHIKNNRMLGIYNGERVICDRPIYEDDAYLFHKIEDGDILSYSKDEVSQVELGYATSVHKTQGITLKNVIFLALDCYAPIMMTSNLVYTGLSRASENLVVFYDNGVLERASYKSLTDKRTTFLGLLADRK